jgi:NAD(P)H-dependent FMN reductase
MVSEGKPLQIAVLAGTTREKRESIKAARLVAEVGREIKGVTITLVDPEDFHFPGDGNDPEGKDPRYTEITARAEAFFIVTPEYNHSFPGSLKRMLDSELKNYIHKPVAFAGVSNGRWGGVRAIEALNQTVREMGLVSTFTDVHFPNVPTLFDENDELIDPVYRRLVRKSYDELIWMAKTLAWGREHVKYPEDEA